METNEIANVILAIVDDEKRFVSTDPDEWGTTMGTVEELRMQLREVAFALLVGIEINIDKLH